MFKSKSYLFYIIAVFLLSTSCNQLQTNSNNNQIEINENNIAEGINIEELVIPIIPARAEEELKNNLKTLENYLEKQINIPIEFELAETYDDVIEKMANESVYISLLGPFSYIKAKELNDSLEPVVGAIHSDTGRPWYTSVIVSNNSSNITELADIKGKRFGFVNQSSTSGFLAPSVAFQDIEINPEEDFANISYSGNHDKNVDALVQGEVDAIAITKIAYKESIKNGKLSEDKYTLVWESDPLPHNALVINNKISEDLQNKIKEAFIKAPEDVIYAFGEGKGSGYTFVSDEDYDIIRYLEDSLEKNKK